MNNAKEIAEAGVNAVAKNLISVLPLGGTAVAIYNELQSKQIERKIKRLEEFYTNLSATVNAVKDKVNKEYVNKVDFLDVFEETTKYVVMERQEEKRQYFKKIVSLPLIVIMTRQNVTSVCLTILLTWN